MARSGGFWASIVFGGAALGAVVGTAYFVSHYQPVTHDNMCVVTAQDGSTYVRTAEAANNAALVAATGVRRDMSTFASTIAVATAIQESGLRNLDYGDRDSLGLFQQRASQGWGTEEQIQDPHYATNTFYRRLKNIDGWEQMRVTDAAQAVQRSGFPEAYEEHAAEGAAWAGAVRGETPFAAIDCDLDAADSVNTAQAFVERIEADYGHFHYTVVVLARNDRAVLLGITADSGEPKDLDAIANWSVAVADEESVASVRYGDVEWLREQGVADAESPLAFDGVRVGLMTALPAD
jgi:hypothetical protein